MTEWDIAQWKLGKELEELRAKRRQEEKEIQLKLDAWLICKFDIPLDRFLRMNKEMISLGMEHRNHYS